MKKYMIVYRYNTLQGPKGTVFARDLTMDQAVVILRNHCDLYERNLMIKEQKPIESA